MNVAAHNSEADPVEVHGSPNAMCGTCKYHVWTTTVRSEPALGDATALISNARSLPSSSTAVGQIEARMLDPAGWFLVTMAVNV